MSGLDWMARAACRGMDVNEFFPVGSGPAVLQQVEEVKAVCRSCPVRSNCLDYAVGGDHPTRYGIWGGLDEDERANERRRRMRRGELAA